MVVFMVTLYPESYMRRPTAVSSLFRALNAGTAGMLVLTAILACGDYGTSVAPYPDEAVQVEVRSVAYTMPDSVKLGLGTGGSASMTFPFGYSADIRSAPAGASAVAACGGSGFAGYTESRVPFTPEPSPRFAVASTSISDDGWVSDADMPIGFDFSFYGNTYNKVNIFMNGFLMFGPAPAKNQSGSAVGGFLPSTMNPKNIIALAWTDWAPHRTTDAIRFETRGTAPNRKFVVQFNNVPELSGTGRLMGQIVLSEGSNDITLYTNSMNVTNSMHFVTQGIQDLTGTQAMWDSVQNVTTGVWSRRVRNFFSLTNDAIRFSLISTADDVKPSITAPEDILQKPNDPGLGSALVVLGDPVASDNCTAPITITKARSDGEPIDAPYPVGITTVTWTAIDAFGNASSDEQMVEVIDVEDPTISVADRIVPATSPNGAIVSYTVDSHDNVAVTSVVCDKESGTLFPIGGPQDVSCTASDAAGHSATVHFNVTVLDARTQLASLIEYVRALDASNGTANPLLNQLTTAYDQLGPDTHVSCVKMSDFLAMIPKKGRQIPFGVTEFMTTEATRIMAVLGCDMKGHAMLIPSGG